MLGFATIVCVAISLANIGVRETMIRRAAYNRILEASFKQADRIVASYKMRVGHLPTDDRAYSTLTGSISVIDPSIGGWDDPDVRDALVMLGQPPRGAYLLAAQWNEEPEFYAPWSGRSTLSFEPDYYSVSGRLWLDVVLSWLVTALFAYATVRSFVAWRP